MAHQQWISQNIQDFQRRKPQTFCFGNFASLALQGPLRVLEEICGKSENWPSNNGFRKTYKISNDENFKHFVLAILLVWRSRAHSGYLEKFAGNLKTGPATIDLAKHTRYPTTKTPTILFRHFCSFGAPGSLSTVVTSNPILVHTQGLGRTCTRTMHSKGCTIGPRGALQ